MNALQGLSPNMGNFGNASKKSSLSTHNFRRMTALRTYQALASEKVSPEENQRNPGILCAVNRWLSTGDVRIEFYSGSTSGEIRVKIIDEEGTQTCDMSLGRFISSGPSSD
jgi:hypothetical protein